MADDKEEKKQSLDEEINELLSFLGVEIEEDYVVEEIEEGESFGDSDFDDFDDF